MIDHSRHLRVAALPAALLVLTSAVASAQDGNRLTVPFSDPARPGTVRVTVFHGEIHVTATAGKEVVVTADDTIVATRQGREVNVPERPEAAGLRRLTQRSGLRVEEVNNVMSISSDRFTGGGDLTIQVPVRTNLSLSAFNDEITVEGIDGEIEVTSSNGSITLTDVTGTIVAHATNGNVRATMRQAAPDKPMSFTSLNGNVDVTLPQAVKANLKLRSDQGDVYTDFDVQIQQQRPAPSANPSKGFAGVPPRPPFPRLPPLPPLPPGASSDPKAREREARERQRQARQQARGVVAGIESGIYGTVNGGGPEFELRTFNGNIYLRRAK